MPSLSGFLAPSDLYFSNMASGSQEGYTLCDVVADEDLRYICKCLYYVLSPLGYSFFALLLTAQFLVGRIPHAALTWSHLSSQRLYVCAELASWMCVVTQGPIHKSGTLHLMLCWNQLEMLLKIFKEASYFNFVLSPMNMFPVLCMSLCSSSDLFFRQSKLFLSSQSQNTSGSPSNSLLLTHWQHLKEFIVFVSSQGEWSLWELFKPQEN